LVDTLDLKSSEQQCSCGFKSRSEYKKLHLANAKWGFFLFLFLSVFVVLQMNMGSILKRINPKTCGGAKIKHKYWLA
jgi:hypothetical protein